MSATVDVTRQRSHSAGTFWIPFAFVAVLACLWALASPLFSVPDENAHATKAIAQVRGELVGAAEAGKKYLVVDLPPGYHYNHSAMCYLFVPTKSAHCAARFGDGTGTAYFENWVGAYNPIYYYLVGWPSLLTDNGSVGVYAMRIASALLGALLLAWAFQAALSSIRARWLPFGLLLVTGPMVLYLLGSVNPNGVEIAAAAALWASLLRLLERHDDRLEAVWSSLPTWYLWLIVTVSSILLANARSVGPLWLVVVVGACVAITGLRAAKAFFTRGRNYLWIGAIAVGTLFAGVWTLATNGAGAQAGTADAPLVGKGFFSGFAAMIRFTPGFLQQQLGVFGWLDTPLPWILYAAISIAIGVLVLLALTGTNRHSAIVIVSALAASILIPAIVQALTISRTGLIWQGRYGLFLFLAIPLLAAWMLSTPAGARVAFLSVRVTWIGLALAGAFSIVAFFAVMRRYVTGFGEGIGAMFHPDWQPPLGWEVLLGLYILAVAGFVLWLGFRARRIAALDDGRTVPAAALRG
ncbi:DUF2142 domain-containing protein [Diaminobutyricibacter sp. McL0608]|uniref:DUF2142 domain-containing protein n=1 Tax=Leifsonia sp. McL0608 TaxID=3143537 RepID=UPI0031F2FE88